MGIDAEWIEGNINWFKLSWNSRLNSASISVNKFIDKKQYLITRLWLYRFKVKLCFSGMLH